MKQLIADFFLSAYHKPKTKEKHFKLKPWFVLAFSLFLGISFVFWGKEISAAVIQSTQNCFTLIIPSLFAFMVLAVFLTSSKTYLLLSPFFSFLSRYLFHIPPSLFPLFLLSQCAGYPVGAKLIRNLTTDKTISASQAKQFMCICYAGGPAFLVGLVGIQVFSSVKIGLLLWGSVFLTNLLLAICIHIRKPVPPKEKIKEIHVQYSTQIFIQSINQGAKSLGMVCITIVFFSILLAVAESSGILSIISQWIGALLNVQQSTSLILLRAFLEISNLSALPQNCYNLLPIIAGLFSFGGCCVILQIAALLSTSSNCNDTAISFTPFFITRLLSMPIAYGMCRLLLHFFPPNLAVSSGVHTKILLQSASPLPAVCLLMMTIILIKISPKSLK